MNSRQIADIKRGTFGRGQGVNGRERGLGERLVIHPPPGDETLLPVAGRGIWMPAARSDARVGDNIDVETEADQFGFDRRDARMVLAAVDKAVIERADGERYVIDGLGAYRSELFRVIVVELDDG